MIEGRKSLPDCIRITVPGDNAALSPNNRMAWPQKQRLVRAARSRAKAAWLLAGQPRYSGPFPVRVEVTVRRQRVMDDDNALGSLKAIRDELFNGAITPGDSGRYVRFEMPKQETGARWKGREEVEFTVWIGGEG